MYSQNPSDMEFSHSNHFCYLDNTVYHVTYLKDAQISAHTIACLPTLVSIATTSFTLHHAVSMSLTYTQSKPQHYLKDTAHRSSKPLRDQIWLPPSGSSLIQLLHLTRSGGGRQSQVHIYIVSTSISSLILHMMPDKWLTRDGWIMPDVYWYSSHISKTCTWLSLLPRILTCFPVSVLPGQQPSHLSPHLPVVKKKILHIVHVFTSWHFTVWHFFVIYKWVLQLCVWLDHRLIHVATVSLPCC